MGKKERKKKVRERKRERRAGLVRDTRGGTEKNEDKGFCGVGLSENQKEKEKKNPKFWFLEDVFTKNGHLFGLSGLSFADLTPEMTSGSGVVAKKEKKKKI